MTEVIAALNQFKRKGWQSAPAGTGWRLEHPSVEGVVYLNMTSQWYSLVCPLRSTEKMDRQSWTLSDQVRIYRYLLEQNEQIFMAKLSLDDEAYPLLMVETPAKSAHQLMLNWAVDSLTRYALEYMAGGNDTAAFQNSAAAGKLLDGGAFYLPAETPGIPKETISRYLKGIEANQWWVKTPPQGLGLNWYLGYKGRLRVFDAYLTVSQNWAYLQVPILLERVPSVLSEDMQLQVLFLKYLLQLNCTWYMAKLGLNSEGYLLLLLEIPIEVLDFPLFQLATSTLATYLDRYVQEIQIMASLQHDQELIELLTRH